MSDIPPPIVLVLVVSEGLYVEPKTGRRTLANLLSVLGAAAYPATMPMLVAHAAVTGLRKSALFVVNVLAADESNALLATEPVLVRDPPDPLAVCEFEVQFENVTVPAPGMYVVQLELDGESLLERRIEFIELEAGDA